MIFFFVPRFFHGTCIHSSRNIVCETLLYSINRLVFVTETERVYCAVRTEFLNIVQLQFSSGIRRHKLEASINPLKTKRVCFI
jgi:hypothetical protein